MLIINGKTPAAAAPNAVVSIPPTGKHTVLNVFFDPESGKVVLKVLNNEEE